MSDRNTDHVLNSIDSALSDTLSPEAMRWAPDAPDQPRETDTWKRIVVTRADLIASGELVEAPADLASEAGWTDPVALTRDAHADTVAWDHGPRQDETGRWWDVLTMARLHAQAGGAGPREVRLHRVPNKPRARVPRPTCLVMRIGPGDAGEPVITLLTRAENWKDYQ